VVNAAFHIMRLGNVMVDEVRRRIQQEALGHRRHNHDPAVGHPPAAADRRRTLDRAGLA